MGSKKQKLQFLLGEPLMTINRLIESIGLSASELRDYVLAEIDEFLASNASVDMEEEFRDILFAIACMGWAHSGRHYALELESIEEKLRGRLREFGTVSRRGKKYTDDRIADMEIGVVHFAFSQFGGQWHHFDYLHNGTVAEIAALTDAPFGQPKTLTNHCIVTFGDVEEVQYDILHSSKTVDSGNTIRCQIPDFMFKHAKKKLAFSQLAELLSLQVLAGIDGIAILPEAVAHFHSWEAGFLIEATEVWRRLSTFKTIFSPYLTTGRLKSVVQKYGGDGWTLTPEELSVSACYERKLSKACTKVVVESSLDHEFFCCWIPPERIEVRSFAHKQSASFTSAPNSDRNLKFISGGRPVREKGFVELCREFAKVHDWALSRGLNAKLSILCRERNPEKGAAYIDQLERIIGRYDLKDVVTIERKVSLEQLRCLIADADALVVPSLFDPFCLMPTYAIEAQRPAFVSIKAGIAENIQSREFIFDPELEGDLARAVREWCANAPVFNFESLYPSYLDLYLFDEAGSTWE